MVRKLSVAVVSCGIALALGACGGGGEVPAGPGTSIEIAADFGVTRTPCPGGHPDRGCIYLGILTDQSGPFANFAPVLITGVRGFWEKVNEEGGIGGHFDVAVPDRLIKDNQYNPAVHTALYTQISDEILALAGSLGTPTTLDVLPRLIEDKTLAVPYAAWSGWSFPEVDQGMVLEFFPSYCVEGMAGVDWAVEARSAASVGVLFFPSDYGRDYLGGVKAAAAFHGLEVVYEQQVIPIAAGGDPAQIEAVNRIVQEPADVVFVVTGASELGSIVGGAVQRGFGGVFVGASPTGDPGLLRSAAAPALTSGAVFGTSPGAPWQSDTVAHRKMRETITAGGHPPHDGALTSWASQYRLKAVLEAAFARGDLTREGLLRASNELAGVDFEGMLPAADYSGSPAESVLRAAVILAIDPAQPTGNTLLRDFFVGPTAAAHAFAGPCS